MKKPGANDPCPCGSGTKYKKCCREAPAASSYTLEERGAAYAKLNAFVDEHFPDEEEKAYDEFWGRFLGERESVPDEAMEVSDFIESVWFSADVPLEDEKSAVDRLLAEGDLTLGERTFLSTLGRSTLRLYEVVGVAPGASLTLRDGLDGEAVTVRERAASRTLVRSDWVVTRVVPRGPSGGAEMEGGVLPIPRPYVTGLLEALRGDRDDFLRRGGGANLATFYKQLPPTFHEVWIGAYLEPQIPRLTNTDGEPLMFTKVRFDVVDAAALERALEGNAELSAESDGRWSWVRGDGEVSLGSVRREGGALVLETNSIERGDQGRALLEAAAGDALRYRATSHEDIQRAVTEKLRDQALRGGKPADPESPSIPVEQQEAMIREYLDTYYERWLDEPVPALEGMTPREAAARPTMRPRVVELLHGLEDAFERARRDPQPGQPVYDPGWMWADLGLADEAPA